MRTHAILKYKTRGTLRALRMDNVQVRALCYGTTHRKPRIKYVENVVEFKTLGEMAAWVAGMFVGYNWGESK